MIHVSDSHVHGNLMLYYVHGKLYIVGMFVSAIITTISIKDYLLERTEISSCIIMM